MNRRLAETIVGCLRLPEPAEGGCAQLSTFREREWRKTLPWLDLSGLALYFWRRVKQTKSDDALPPAICARFEKNLLNNRARLAAMAEEFDGLNRRFEVAGIDYAVLKGFALFPDYCPDLGLRSSFDFDYLLGPESTGAAHQALVAAGYELARETDGHRVYKSNSCRVISSLEESYSPSLGREVELHFRLWNEDTEGIDLQPVESPLARAQWRTFPGCRFRSLAEEDHFVFVVLHAFWHVLHGGCRMSHFHEVARFLASRPSQREGFWTRVRELLEARRHLGQALGVVFRIATDLYGAEVPSELRPLTTGALAPPRRLWVDLYGREFAFRIFSGNKFGLFLHREFIEEPQAWRRVRRQRLFPFHRLSKLAQGSAHFSSARRKVSREVRGYLLKYLFSRLYGPIEYGLEWPRWWWARRRKLKAPLPTGRPEGVQGLRI